MQQRRPPRPGERAPRDAGHHPDRGHRRHCALRACSTSALLRSWSRRQPGDPARSRDAHGGHEPGRPRDRDHPGHLRRRDPWARPGPHQPVANPTRSRAAPSASRWSSTGCRSPSSAPRQWASVNGAGGSTCDDGTNAELAYLQVKVEVSWPALGTRPPVHDGHDHDPAQGHLLGNLTGHVGVKVIDRLGGPQSGIGVRRHRPQRDQDRHDLLRRVRAASVPEPGHLTPSR